MIIHTIKREAWNNFPPQSAILRASDRELRSKSALLQEKDARVLFVYKRARLISCELLLK